MTTVQGLVPTSTHVSTTINNDFFLVVVVSVHLLFYSKKTVLIRGDDPTEHSPVFRVFHVFSPRKSRNVRWSTFLDGGKSEPLGRSMVANSSNYNRCFPILIVACPCDN
jgi:hypothetical protein